MFGQARWLKPTSPCSSAVTRGKFLLQDNLVNTRIRIVGLGIFELYINGNPVGDDLFLPLNTDFHERPGMLIRNLPFGEQTAHRLYVTEYDISPYVHGGENTIAVHVGTGWYADRMELKFGDICLCWRIYNSQNDIGSTDMIWKEGFVKDCVYRMGETQDLRGFDENWMAEETDTEGYISMLPFDFPPTDYLFSACPADGVIRTLQPKEIACSEEYTVFDVGENITGYPIIRLKEGCEGEVCLLFAETAKEDGHLCETTMHKQKEVFLTDALHPLMHPRFVWFGFRYFSVTNNAYPIECRVIHTKTDVTSSFASSSLNLNWLYDAYIRTQLCNMHTGIPSDCPHLERRGYTGDGQLTCEAAMLLLDAKEFYRKWIYDISDCQDRLTGHVQYTAPYTHSGGGPGGWGCAMVEVPYLFYQTYGETGPMADLYPQMLFYFQYLDAHSEEDLIVSDRPLEWCLGDWCTPDPIAIPAPYVNNYFYIKSLYRVKEMAATLGYVQDIPLLEEKIRIKTAALIKAYWDEKTGNFAGNVQGANGFALDLGLGDERTQRNMVEKYRASGEYDTGIFGTDVVTRVLFERGEGELAIQLLTSEKKNSFSTMRVAGATTLWEYWYGKRSHSHPMFGAVTRYLFRYILGIQQTKDSVGYENLRIAPCPGGIECATGSLLLPCGRVSVSFEQQKDAVSFAITLPEGKTAAFVWGKHDRLLQGGENRFIV